MAITPSSAKTIHPWVSGTRHPATLHGSWHLPRTSTTQGCRRHFSRQARSTPASDGSKEPVPALHADHKEYQSLMVQGRFDSGPRHVTAARDGATSERPLSTSKKGN